MKRLSVEELLEKVDSVAQNLVIYKNDLKRFTKKLQKEFDLTEEELSERPEEIEEELEGLEKKKRKLVREIQKDLEDVGA